MAIQEGVWDCQSCEGTNRGRNIRCQGCGEARGEDVEFYLPEDATDITEDNPLYAEAAAGADWICGYCDTSNRASDGQCKGCGAGSDDGKHRQVREVPPAASAAAPPPKPAAPMSWKPVGVLAGILVSLLLFAWWGNRTTEDLMKVVGSEWTRTIQLQEYRTLQKNDWASAAPRDPRVLSRDSRHKTDRDVLVRIETRYRDVTRKVQTGTRQVKCGKIDMGNGYFKDKMCDEPVYKTVNEREPYDHRVTRKEPVYEDWLRYEVDRWVPVDPAFARGDDHQPEWPVVALGEKRKEAGREATYELKLRKGSEQFEWEATEELFMKCPPGADVFGSLNNFGKLVGVKPPGDRTR